VRLHPRTPEPRGRHQELGGAQCGPGVAEGESGIGSQRQARRQGRTDLHGADRVLPDQVAEPTRLKPLNVVLIGPPGSAKGTQAVRIAERLSIPHISTGDILRAAVKAQSPLGRAVADTLAAGALVSDEIMTELVRDRLAAEDTTRGFILDGFPRTEGQARALDTMRPPVSLRVILIDVS